VEGVTIGFEPGTNGIAGFAIRGVVLSIDWGSGGGQKVSKKSHDPLVVDGMGGNVPSEDKGGTSAIGTKSGPNEFMIRGLYGGRNPLVKKSSSKLESWDVQIDSM